MESCNEQQMNSYKHRRTEGLKPPGNIKGLAPRHAYKKIKHVLDPPPHAKKKNV